MSEEIASITFSLVHTIVQVLVDSKKITKEQAMQLFEEAKQFEKEHRGERLEQAWKF